MAAHGGTEPAGRSPRRWNRAAHLVAVGAGAVLLGDLLVLAIEPDQAADAAISTLAEHPAASYDGDQALLDPLVGLGVEVPAPGSEPVDPATPLPTPAPPPDDPRAPTPEVRLGQLEIPKIGLNQPLFEGVTLTAINRGPSHWPGTAGPGEVGNMVVAGHRTTYTKPFWSLDELVAGDEMIISTDRGRFVYRATGTEIVDDTAIHIVDQVPARVATLFACHPRGSARQRIVAHFELVPQTQRVPLLPA